MPGRLGPRFAVEAGFLVLLAVGAGLADLRPRVIVVVMAVAWVLVALVEFTADRLASTFQPWRRSIVDPTREPAASAAEADALARDPHSATVVTPVPEELSPSETADELPAEAVREAEPAVPAQGEAVVEQESAPSAEAEAGVEPAADDEGEAPSVQPALEPLEPRPKRRWFHRRGGGSGKGDEELEDAQHTLPRHVRLLPPRAESSRASQEVAEIFDAAGRDEREERGR